MMKKYDVTEELKLILQKQNVFVHQDDPAFVICKALLNGEIKQFEEFDKFSRKTLETMYQDCQRVLAETLRREIYSFNHQLQMEKQKHIEDCQKIHKEILEKNKQAAQMQWSISLAFWLAALIIAFWLPSKAKAASVGFRTTNYNAISSFGAEGGFGNQTIAVSGNYNKGVSNDKLAFGGATLKLFPTAVFNFGLNYDTASHEKISAEAFGFDLGLSSAIFNIRLALIGLAVGDRVNDSTTSMYDVTVKTLITPSFSIEPSFKYALGDKDTKASSIEIATLYKWSDSFDSVHGIGYVCSDKCENPFSGLFGIKYTAKKMSVTLSSRSTPNTLLAPIATKVLEHKEDKIVSHQLKFSTLF